ncbi:hypothetical protein C8Q79DRAFT_919235, partial [Trametes meyenii]
YEYLITFEDGFRLIWRGKLTGASVIFLLDRQYIIVVQNAITIASIVPLPNTVRLWPPMYAAFSTLRVYAISGRDWRISSVVCVLMLRPLVSNIVHYFLRVPRERRLCRITHSSTHPKIM